MGLGLGMPSDNSSPNAAPGVQFSEEKQSRVIQPLSVGDGILGKDKSSPQEVRNTTDKHLEKATSLLDELSREERSGFKADLSNLDKNPSDNSAKQPVNKEISEKDDGKKAKSDDDNYEDEFEEIDEDLPEQDPELELGGGLGIGQSMGITVSQSLGIDPSVDSLALEDYDHIEPVEKLNQ